MVARAIRGRGSMAIQVPLLTAAEELVLVEVYENATRENGDPAAALRRAFAAMERLMPDADERGAAVAVFQLLRRRMKAGAGIFPTDPSGLERPDQVLVIGPAPAPRPGLIVSDRRLQPSDEEQERALAIDRVQVG
jgi:hypothetical protein